MWNYAINGNLLDREFSVKWWDSLKINKIISQMYEEYPPPVEKPIALRTRSQSSLDSVQISGKSSKELKELAQQLESEEQNSPTASVGSVNHDPSDPFQDAQDPYSGYDLDKI